MSDHALGSPRGVARRSPLRSVVDKLYELYRARGLLKQFVSKELKVRYKGSALGFLWSLLTPALMTVVFTVVFGFLFRLGIEDFAAFFLSGFLVWQFFQNSATASVNAIVGNGALIKKVYFPREVLPLSGVLSQLVHLFLAFVAVSPYLIVSRGTGWLVHLPALLLGMVLLAIFTAGVSMFLAGANVFFRDLQELIVVIFQVWFYATPVIYPFAFVAKEGSATAMVFEKIILANPMTWFVKLFHDGMYGTIVAAPDPADLLALDTLGITAAQAQRALDTGGLLTLPASWPGLDVIGACTFAAVVSFTLGYLAFQRFAVNFAKEI